MKKLTALFACVIFGSALIFAQSAEKQAKTAPSKPASEEMQALETAYTLAAYGYANDSASALITAAEILSSVDLAALSESSDFVSKKGTSVESEQSTGVDYTAQQLLDDAKELYGKDKTLKAWAASVQKLVDASKATRGTVSGPYYDVDCVSGNGGTCTYTITYYGNEYAEAGVYSLDGCDYDIFVYDANGNFITQDVSYSSSAYCSWVPRWTGSFQIVVKNRSGYAGRYRFTTN